MQLRRRLWNGTHKDKGKEEDRRGGGREQYSYGGSLGLLERHGKKLHN
jgi:hypothetical protein